MKKMKHKELLKINANSTFYKIKNFFKKLFKKNEFAVTIEPNSIISENESERKYIYKTLNLLG